MEATIEKPRAKKQKKKFIKEHSTNANPIAESSNVQSITSIDNFKVSDQNEPIQLNNDKKKDGDKNYQQFEAMKIINPILEDVQVTSNDSQTVNKYKNFNEFDRLLLANKEIVNSVKLSEINLNDKTEKLVTTASKGYKQIEHCIKPYLESQLAALYTNYELENIQQFVSNFVEAELKGTAVKRHPLYELLEKYLQARNKMIGNNLEYEQLRTEYNEMLLQIWSTEQIVASGRGECHDGSTLLATHSYTKATFHRSVFQTIGRILTTLRKVVVENQVLYSYFSEILKSQIEVYLQSLIMNCLNISQLQQNAPVSLTITEPPSYLLPILSELRLCISVLFSFQRRLIRDIQFIKETRDWLSQLIALLLRLSNWQDHLFILNHILRCPPGVGSWAAHYIQMPLVVELEHSPFSSYTINHAITILSSILMPIEKREAFLEQFVQSKENPDDVLWVIVDSEGEEDDESSGISLRENDLVQFLNQLPIDNIFRAVLLIESRNQQDCYQSELISENHILRFLAFATTLLRIFRQGLQNYGQLRYNQFSKRLCRFIRHLVQYATDQWEEFQRNQNIEDVAMLERLQVEYDAFFLRATQYLYSSQKVGAWQFLAVVPYHMVSLKTLWRIFYLLHDNDDSVELILDPTSIVDYKTKLWNDSLRSQFEEKLTLLDVAESYYLLNTFANMALARGEEDLEFITATVMDLLEVGFKSEATQDICSKNARILLTHITSKHPNLISDILSFLKSNFMFVGCLSLYLFEELPLSIWHPCDNDMETISSWLRHGSINTDETRLARMILSRLNWDLTSEGLLFLNYNFHYNVALLLAEVVEQDCSYLQWAWQTAYRLRLHINDKGILDLSRVPELDNISRVSKGVREQKPFFCFLALIMTSWGHLVPLVCTKGLILLENLQTHQKHDTVIFCLHLMVPLFLDCQESLINNEKFQNILSALINADRTYINMAKSLVTSQNVVLEQFGNMIKYQIKNFKFYNLESPRCLVRLWMNSLVSIPSWNRDQNVLYLLDIIVKVAFFYSDAMEAVVNILRDLLQCITPQENIGTLSSLFKWASQSTLSQANLLSGNSLGSFVWLAYVLIGLEHDEKEKQTGLWNEILMQLKNQKGKINVDAAIKKAANAKKVSSFTSSSLCIYRWAQQALDTPIEHPILSLIWQKFFTLYLARISVANAAEKGCLGEKFFDGIINLGFFKKLKKRLQETVDFYQTKTDTCDNNEETDSRKQFYKNCLRMFRAYALWLEEPHLQESNLYLPSLPSQYQSQLLALIIQGYDAPWYEYVDHHRVMEDLTNSMKIWRKSIFREKSNINQPLPNVGKGLESVDPVERILKRLISYDTPKPPPIILKTTPVIPALDIHDKSSLMKSLKPHIKVLQQFAHNHTLRLSEYKALNSTYKELIPQLYRTVLFKIKKKVLCKGTGNLGCTGAAEIILEMQEARINENVEHQIHGNRNDYEIILNKCLREPAQSLCISSVVIQKSIDILQIQSKANPEISEVAVDLFYYLLSLISEEISLYPPTKQLLNICLEKLGQTFICGNEHETPRLLHKILEEPSLISLLSPHFSPVNLGTTNLLYMYSTICDDIENRFEIMYPLISKFDIPNWLLSKQPKLNQRTQFIDIVIKGLARLNFEPPADAMMIHEIFRKHLLSIFEYQFPEHYGDVLLALLKASSGNSEMGSISVSVWLDIFNSLARPNKLKLNSSREQLRQYAQQQGMLSHQELVETSRLLATHFFQERLQYGLYGLYPKYRNYMEVIILLLGMIGHALIISSLNTHQGVLGDKLCEIMWPSLRDIYAPWILPYWMQNVKGDMASWMQQLTDDRAVLLPWIPADGPYAQKTVQMLFECIQFIIHTLPACNNMFSFIWHWYVTNFAHAAVKDHVLNVIHASFFALPWQNFWPSVADVELMFKVIEQYLPDCHVFLGHIFMNIMWPNWMKHILQTDSKVLQLRTHQCILHLLIKLPNEPHIRSNYNEKAKNLLVQVETLNWDIIEPEMYQQIMDWYVMSCNPLVLLVTDSLDLDYRILHFLKVVAHYDTVVEQNTSNLLLKRHIYIRSYVKLITVLISKHKSTVATKINQINSLIHSNLEHLEVVVFNDEEFQILLGEIFALLNIENMKHNFSKCFEQWISTKTANSRVLYNFLRTLGNIVADNEIMVNLYETAINTYFTNNTNQDSKICWKQLVNFIKPYAPKQVELEQLLLAQGKLLTLHVLLIQKVRNCTDAENLLNTILHWMSNLKISSSMEDQVPLLWSQFLNVAYIYCQINESNTGVVLYKFSQTLLQMISEKGITSWSRGLLGAIGIVKQDNVSIKFKFLCRALAGFVLAQLPDTKGEPQKVRHAANVPGTVGQPGGNVECVKILLNLDFGQSQGEIKACAELALKQIQDPNNSLHNSRKFLNMLVTQLYTKPYLKDIDVC